MNQQKDPIVEPQFNQPPYFETGHSENYSLYHKFPEVHYVYKNYQVDKNLYHENPLKDYQLIDLEPNYAKLHIQKQERVKQINNRRDASNPPLCETPHKKNLNQHQCFLVDKSAVKNDQIPANAKKQLYLQKRILAKSVYKIATLNSNTNRDTIFTQKEMIFNSKKVETVRTIKSSTTNNLSKDTQKMPKKNPILANNLFEIIANQDVLNKIKSNESSALMTILRENWKELQTFSDLKDATFSVLLVKHHPQSIPKPAPLLNPSFADKLIKSGTGSFIEDSSRRFVGPPLRTSTANRNRHSLHSDTHMPLQDLSKQTILENDDARVLPTFEIDQEIIEKITLNTFTKMNSVVSAQRAFVAQNSSLNSGPLKNEFSHGLMPPSFSTLQSNIGNESGFGNLQRNATQSVQFSSKLSNTGFVKNSFEKIKEENEDGNLKEGISFQNISLVKNSVKSQTTKVSYQQNFEKIAKITELDLKDYYKNDKYIFGDPEMAKEAKSSK